MASTSGVDGSRPVATPAMETTTAIPQHVLVTMDAFRVMRISRGDAQHISVLRFAMPCRGCSAGDRDVVGKDIGAPPAKRKKGPDLNLASQKPHRYAGAAWGCRYRPFALTRLTWWVQCG